MAGEEPDGIPAVPLRLAGGGNGGEPGGLALERLRVAQPLERHREVERLTAASLVVERAKGPDRGRIAQVSEGKDGFLPHALIGVLEGADERGDDFAGLHFAELVGRAPSHPWIRVCEASRDRAGSLHEPRVRGIHIVEQLRERLDGFDPDAGRWIGQEPEHLRHRRGVAGIRERLQRLRPNAGIRVVDHPAQGRQRHRVGARDPSQRANSQAAQVLALRSHVRMAALDGVLFERSEPRLDRFETLFDPRDGAAGLVAIGRLTFRLFRGLHGGPGGGGLRILTSEPPLEGSGPAAKLIGKPAVAGFEIAELRFGIAAVSGRSAPEDEQPGREDGHGAEGGDGERSFRHDCLPQVIWDGYFLPQLTQRFTEEVGHRRMSPLFPPRPLRFPFVRSESRASIPYHPLSVTRPPALKCRPMGWVGGRGYLVLGFWAGLLLGGCERAPADRFVDIAAAAAVEFRHETGAAGERHVAETVGSGAAWFDYDIDGDLDLFCASGNERPAEGGPGISRCRLFRNEGNRRFRDATKEAGVAAVGYAIGTAVGDYDNDGRPDLYVTCFTRGARGEGAGGNVLYHNEGGGRFRDATADADVAPGGFSTAAAFLDYDEDGLLDLYVVRYVHYDPRKRCTRGGVPVYCGPNDFPGEPDVLYRNLGGGKFEDASAAAGIACEDSAGGAGLGILPLDFDDDGDTDIFVANDQGPNYLWRNNGGKFADVALAVGVAYSPDGSARAGMGVDAADLDADGREEIAVTHFADEPAGLFAPDGRGLFRDLAVELDLAGPTLLPLGFGVAFLDHDLDGDMDLYIANGHVLDNIERLRPGSGQTFAQRDLLLDNDGGRFHDISAGAGSWFREARVGRGVALADFDEDGDDDLFVVNAGGKGALLENRTPKAGGWCALKLRGTRSNRDGYGARVAVIVTEPDGAERTRFFEVRSARSYASACDPRIRVGIGARPPRSIRALVRWPGPARTVAEYKGIEPGRTTELVEPAEPPSPPVAFAVARPAGPTRTAAPGKTVGAAASSSVEGAAPHPRETAPEDPTRTAAALARVRELYSAHRFAEALAVLDREARGEGPSGADALLLRAELLFNLLRFEEAAELLEILVEILARRSGAPLRARLLLARAQSALGRHGKAIERFEVLLAEGADLGGQGRRAYCRSLADSGRLDDARREIGAALLADPWLDEAYLDLGHVLQLLGRPERASPFLEGYRAGENVRRKEREALDLEMQGRAADAAFARGEMERLRGRALRALGHFNRALAAAGQCEARHGPAFVALLRLSVRLERQDEALAQIESAHSAPAIDAVREEIERSRGGDGDLARARGEIRARMAGRPLGACGAELSDLARAFARGGESSWAREVALFAAELAPREGAPQRAVAELFDRPEEAYVRLWALTRAAKLAPGDAEIARDLEALRKDLAITAK